MIRIEPVTAASAPAARRLFQQYGQFLAETQPAEIFQPAVFAREIEQLPAPFTDRNGEVLLASVNGIPAACIAFRTGFGQPRSTCEIKRLFVLPEHRGQGLARQLVVAVLTHARTHGYDTAILDTDTVHMPTAAPLYRSFGFREYAPRQGSIAYFRLTLPPVPPTR